MHKQIKKERNIRSGDQGAAELHTEGKVALEDNSDQVANSVSSYI